MQSHLRYITTSPADGITSDGVAGVVYNTQGEHADVDALGRVEIDEAQAEIVHEIFARYGAGESF